MDSESCFNKVSGITTDSLTQSSTLPATSGSSYIIRYKVKNIYEWSDNYSPTLTIKVAVVPNDPLNVMTATVIMRWVLLQVLLSLSLRR
jgi:hypothetical protein